MTTPALPAPEQVHVVVLPLRTRFRGVVEREALLLRGPAGWGEFSPFAEYDDHESARWLAAALEAAHEGAPDPLRVSVEVNATVPAVPAGEVAGVLGRLPRLPHGQGQGRRARPGPRRRPRPRGRRP